MSTPATNSKLPEDVLLRIFYFGRLTYLDEERGSFPGFRLFWRWHRLAHVCHRWRSVVFGSPNFLDLRLVCPPGRRMELADIWPPFPIVVTNINSKHKLEDYDFDATIVHHDRVCQITLLGLTSPRLQRLASAMQVQFQALIDLTLFSLDRHPALALPDGFLGGSGPRLQSLQFHFIPFLRFQNFFCLRLTLSASTFRVFPMPGTSHRKQSSLVWPCWPTSHLSPLDSNPLDLTPTGKFDVHRRLSTSSSLLSLACISKGSANTWRMSWPGLMPLCLTPSG